MLFRQNASTISFRHKKSLWLLLLAIVLLLSAFVGIKKVFDAKSQDSNIANQPVQISQSGSNGTIGKEFIFPLVKSAKDEKFFKFFIDKAALVDEIVIKGQKATAVKGRDFLIVTVKITNEHDKAFKINTKDFVRLSANNNTAEWLAPDIHNDPVEVQAISTKVTRVGFPVNESDTNFVLQVGEIDGAKETITLNLK